MESRGAVAGGVTPDNRRAFYDEDTPVDDLPLETVYNECRSALMTVYLQTLLPGALLQMLRSQMPDGLMPMSLDEAVGAMAKAAPSYSQGTAAGPPSASAYLWRSQQLATELLAEAYYVRGQEQVRPHLEALLRTSASTVPGTGAITTTSRTLEEFEAQLFPPGQGGVRPPRGPLPLAHVARVAFGLPAVRVEQPAPGPLALQAEEPPQPKTELAFKPDTLTTTVTVSALTRLGIQELRSVLDPQAWRKSLFWRKAHRVFQQGKEFLPEEVTELGARSWESLFYEAVEWNWNDVTVCEFRNYLCIRYSLNETGDPRNIDMGFHLYKSQGGRLPFLESASGVDVDNGYLKARPVEATVTPPGSPPGGPGEKEPVYFIETRKNVRFTDLLADQPVIADILGRGILNLLTPALLTLWMRELVTGIHVEEQQRAQQGMQLPAGSSSWPLPQ